MHLFYLSKEERNSLLCLIFVVSLISFGFGSIKKDPVEIIKNKVYLPINKSNRTQLQEIKGIGPVLSDRLVKYRNRLGGFNNLDQLQDIYGIDTSNFQLIAEQIFIDSIWHQFDINNVEFKVLLRHPYFDYPVVKAIFNYRDYHADYDSLQELKALDLVNDELYGKIVPYLKIRKNGIDIKISN